LSTEERQATIAPHAMSEADLELARQFLDVLAGAAGTGDREAIYPLLAPDIEWVTPQRELHGIEEARDELTWISPRETLDVEYDQLQMTDLGEGRILSNVHETFRMKGSGAFAYARDRQIDLTIRDGKIVRYEMRIVG
jgi:ketosteroid isomerase-like protein